MNWPDHVLAAALIVVFPLYGVWDYRRFVRRVREGVPGARASQYRATMIEQWGLTLALAAIWLDAGRPASVLGLALPRGTASFVGAAIVAVVLTLLVRQTKGIARRDAARLAPLRAQLASVAELIPRSPAETRWFNALAVTAGICEELLYRGFLMYYVGAVTGMWTAALIAGAAFGFAHIYQGGAGVVKTGVTGILMGLLYAGTGSLLWGILLHATIDVANGASARRILASEPPEAGGARRGTAGAHLDATAS